MRAAYWAFICRLFKQHDPQWVYGDGVKVKYCFSCAVVTDVDRIGPREANDEAHEPNSGIPT